MNHTSLSMLNIIMDCLETPDVDKMLINHSAAL